MDDYRFYHLTKTPLDKSLPRLLEKVLASKARCVVVSPDQERIDALDTLLWTYGPGSFLAHGAGAADRAADHPIWLTTQMSNPNGASVLVALDGYTPDESAPFEKCLYFFDGNDGEMLKKARSFYRSLLERDHKPIYYQQDDKGTWSMVGSSANAA